MTSQSMPQPVSKVAWQIEVSIDDDLLTVAITAALSPSGQTADNTDLTISAHDETVLTALVAIVRTLDSLSLQAAREPAKAGTAPTPTRQSSHPWSPADDQLLISRQEAGATIPEPAVLHGRSIGAIRSRLHLLNFKPEKVDKP